MIDLERTPKWTMLTVCNYDSYQSEGQAEGISKGNQEPVIKEYKEIKEEYKPIILAWIAYRKQLKKPLTDYSLKTLCNKVVKEGLDKTTYTINNSIENGWQGLFWDKYKDIKQPTNEDKLYSNVMKQVNMYKK